ncbi:Pnap_2097 family protein [Salipiger marinus]|uniref:Pnap_2097 family protein n=1 Tax=Salipiger marinus TaxID=555512 RepID=UPI001E4A7180|nr:Pnap_2097 family protein [Salipiger manganoxidans]MCD1618737.1 hypothetical protein [Salipiger manganoxidans]MEB3417823.1 Pnap_2097 family protein [Salipiger manganoxidans]
MRARTALRSVGGPRRVERRESLSLGMAMLSPFGLSEQWLLRDAGDRHWTLIADALGQSGIAFRDAEGHPVYAAFCATELTLARPSRPLLGTGIEITSTLHVVAANRIGSEHHIAGAEGWLGTLRMISCFLRHDGSGSNRRLLRSSLPGLDDLAAATPGLDRQHARARTLARQSRDTPATGPELLVQTPVPALDFNAVGLLYFPTFSRLAEAARPCPAPLTGREVVYLGNLDQGEHVTVRAAATGLQITSGPRLLALVETTC